MAQISTPPSRSIPASRSAALAPAVLMRTNGPGRSAANQGAPAVSDTPAAAAAATNSRSSTPAGSSNHKLKPPWALVLALPISLGLSLVALAQHPLARPVSARAWLGFAYVGVISMYFGFFAWYAGLSRTTIARASQVQLAQPVLGLFWSWLLLGERVTFAMLLTAGFVLLCAACASRARVRVLAPPSVSVTRPARRTIS